MTTIQFGSKGQAVQVLQRLLNLSVDGIFGEITKEAVIAFQKSHSLVPDGVVGAKTWAALNASSTSTRTIKEIIVHCSATAEGKDYTVEQIRQWHKARGFNDIGYHYVIYRDGSRNVGRAESVIGAHCTGHNTYSIGVCYIGGYASDGKTVKDTRTDAQKEGLLKLLKELKVKYPNAKIYSHKDFANKACPCFDATKEYANV